MRARYRVRHLENDAPAAEDMDAPEGAPSLLHMAASLALAATACAAGYGLEKLSGWHTSGVLWLTLLVVALATTMPRTIARLRGAESIGTLLMQVFFATIGASAHIGSVLRVGPWLFAFAALILLTHMITILIGGKLLLLDLAEIVIASNANIGGATTSAAMAVARRWNLLVIPAILCGTLGYAIGTFIGVGVGRFLAR